MPSVLGVDVAGILGSTVGAAASDATLRRATQQGRISGQATRGTQVVFDDYPCKAYSKEYSSGEIDGDRVRAGDRKIGVYAITLLDDSGAQIVPREGDRIVLEEEDLGVVEYSIIGVPGRGTGGARYIVQGRRA